MKIEKFHTHDIEATTATGIVLKAMAEKFNEIIDALSCPKCGKLKGVVGSGLCFPCDQEEEEKYHRK